MLCATALFVLLSAAARAWIVSTRGRRSPGLLFTAANPLHHICRRTLVAKFTGHELHVGVNVVEEQLVPGAQIIQSVFAIGRLYEAMFGTFAVAGEANVAFAAEAREGLELVVTELPLLLG
jgi:hypothetical protein